jgi:uncharacterized membrane protein
MESLLPGLKGMLNYHPLFVHFPIAFWLGALLFELLGQWRADEPWRATAERLLYLGTLAALPALVTGLLAETAVPEGPARAALTFHKTVMMITTGAAVALCMLVGLGRGVLSPGRRKLFLAGLVVLAVLLALGADRGALLVYQHGTGVNWPQAQQPR